MKCIVSKERCEELLANWNDTHKNKPFMNCITKYAECKIDVLLYDDIDNTTFCRIDGAHFWIDNDFIEEVDEQINN